MHFGKDSSRQRPHDAALRAELQVSQASTRALATRHAVNPETVAKWRKRTTTML